MKINNIVEMADNELVQKLAEFKISARNQPT